MKCCVVFMTVPDRRTGRRIGQALLRQRLAACVNTVSGVHSCYWWKGRIESAREEILIIKTASVQVRSLIREVKRIHPYAVPEIIAVPIAAGDPDYLRWVRRSIQARGGHK